MKEQDRSLAAPPPRLQRLGGVQRGRHLAFPLKRGEHARVVCVALGHVLLGGHEGKRVAFRDLLPGPREGGLEDAAARRCDAQFSRRAAEDANRGLLAGEGSGREIR